MSAREYFNKIAKLKKFKDFTNNNDHLKQNEEAIIEFIGVNKLYPFDTRYRHVEWISKLYHWCTPEELKERLEYFPDKIINIEGITQKERNYKLYGKAFAEHMYKKSFKNYSKSQKERNKDPEKRVYWPTNRKFWRNFKDGDERHKAALENNYNSQLRGDKWHNSARRDWYNIEFWAEKGVENPEKSLKKAKAEHSRGTIEGHIKAMKDRYGTRWKEEYRNLKKHQASFMQKAFRPRTSNVSKEAFKEIIDRLGIEEYQYEWFINDGSDIYFYDLKINNLLVEYDGLAWHYYSEFPDLYRGHIFGVSKEEITKKDKFKTNLAKKAGFNIVRIHDKMTIEEMVKIVEDGRK